MLGLKLNHVSKRGPWRRWGRINPHYNQYLCVILPLQNLPMWIYINQVVLLPLPNGKDYDVFISVGLSVCPSVCVSAHQSIPLSVCPSICLSVCLKCEWILIKLSEYVQHGTRNILKYFRADYFTFLKLGMVEVFALVVLLVFICNILCKPFINLWNCFFLPFWVE